jgi:acetylornithine deacetylase/succinyl-diaminopimelate desuccinylase-like protein
VLDDLVRALVSINSANPATFPGGPGERAVAEYCRDWLVRHGAAAELVHADGLPGRPGVIAEAGPGGDPTLLLVGHLDTYRWYRPSFVEDRAYGPGASDMKGGVAAILAVLAQGVPSGIVRALLVPDEEHASLGIRSLLPRVGWDAAVVVEDTGLCLGTGHAGSLTAYLPVEQAHLRAYALPPDLRRQLRCGFDRNRPDLLALRLVVPPGVDAVALRAALPGDGWTVRESFLASLTGPLPAALLAAGTAAGLAMTPVRLPGWTEAGVLASTGRPCMVFGPGGGGAHTTAEWVDLGQVRTASRVLASTAARYCEDGWDV